VDRCASVEHGPNVSREQIAADLTAWLRLLALLEPLQACEPKALRYRLLHVPARLVRSGQWRQPRFRPAGPGPHRSSRSSPGSPRSRNRSDTARQPTTRTSETRTAAPRGTARHSHIRIRRNRRNSPLPSAATGRHERPGLGKLDSGLTIRYDNPGKRPARLLFAGE